MSAVVLTDEDLYLLRLARAEALVPPERLELLHLLGWPTDLPERLDARVAAAAQVVVAAHVHAAVTAERARAHLAESART